MTKVASTTFISQQMQELNKMRLDSITARLGKLEEKVLAKAKGWEKDFAKKCVSFIRRDMVGSSYFGSANHKADNFIMEMVEESLNNGTQIDELVSRNREQIALYHAMGARRIGEVSSLLKSSRQ